MRTQHLYLLVFPEKDVIKVGKANDIWQRLGSLRQWWGEPDLAGSYFIEATDDMVGRLEKALHCFLVGYAAMAEVGDGRTELFRLEALPVALQLLDLHIAGGPAGGYKLLKGIHRPVEKSPTGGPTPTKDRVLDQFRKRSVRMLDSLDATLANLRYLRRLVILLRRWEHRIQFQWERTDGSVLLRFRGNAGLLRALQSSEVWGAFSFALDDSQGLFHSVNLLRSRQGSDDVVQFDIGCVGLAPDYPDPDALVFLLRDAMQWMDVLPTKSSAVAQDIPVLHFNGVAPGLV
jgi:hypothetical protein